MAVNKGNFKAKSLEVRNPTCKVLGSVAKNLGTQSIFLGAPDYRAPVTVRQQSCT